MSNEKLSSDAVPAKFVDWLLVMGCPAEKVPSLEKLTEMCRGQYYMVWRSMMEHVEPKDVTKQKRLQVFCDDIHRVKLKNVLNKRNSSAIEPEQLTLWRQQTELKQKVADAKFRVALVRKDHKILMDKVSGKMSQRNVSRRRVEDLQRRAWLLQEVAQDLQTKKGNLHETRAIADSLCTIDEDGDIQDKLDKCVASLRRSGAQFPANPAASSVLSTNGDNEFEEQLRALVKCHGDALCTQLYQRRAGLIPALSSGVASEIRTPESPRNRLTPESVLSHTAALHCTLALEASKNRIHLKHAHKRLTAAVTELNNYLASEACELLVIRCEKAHVEARVRTLQSLLDELTSRSGIFQAGDETKDRSATARPIAAVDKAIENKREELKKVIASLAATERKIQNVKECLVTLFNGFCKDVSPVDYDRFRGLQLDLPQESIATLRQFYETQRERRRSKLELSMELDFSDGSFGDAIETNNPRFTDELKVYLKKFCLEKNRKLILDSGEKIWTFETLQSSVARFHSKCLTEDMTSSLICPLDSLMNNLLRIMCEAQSKAEMEGMCRGLDGARSFRDIEIKSQIEEEHQTTDKIKKRLNDNLLTLQKTEKTLDLGQETLSLWSDNKARKCISPNRTVDGMSYREYEAYYVENCISK